MIDITKRPRTLLPPPLVYASGFVVGWYLAHWQTLAFTTPILVRWIAWSVVAVSIGLMLWAVLTIWHYRTTVNPYGQASTLVSSGPFAFSRNPIYLADALLYLAASILWQNGWTLVLAPVIWLIMRYAVIRHEEAHLHARFGKAYEVYCQRTARWLGQKKG